MAHDYRIKKLALKVEYPPTLRVYSRMDDVAIKLASYFPDWERGAVAIELRNWDRRHTFKMLHKESLFLCDDPPVLNDDVRLGIHCLEAALKRFDCNRNLTASVGIHFVSGIDTEFDQLVHAMDAKFHVPQGSIPAFNGFTLLDTSYTIELKDDGHTGWTRKITAGPMTRTEWLSKNSLTVRISHLTGEEMDRHKQSVPPVFVFLALDSTRAGMGLRETIDMLPQIVQSTTEMANSFMAYCKD